MEKKINIKRIIWKVLLIVAILPFVVTLGVGIWHSIFGIHDGICILCDRPLVYGFEAFGIVMIFAVWLCWPVYLIAAIIIIIAIIRLVMLKREINNNKQE